ncbi:hypothetical protein PILCRDRAFT_16908 [Piloderma croceum F 1598]|uniref:Uncharacterized protein n=1 Tax=Piloderma croceum (strain F 1598) TaxID=765440 RepID=A0A0C3EUA3_PILCF|nr:hypothetical protein PILCRDRAFT_16908 [Piloderma croceum F 1598]
MSRPAAEQDIFFRRSIPWRIEHDLSHRRLLVEVSQFLLDSTFLILADHSLFFLHFWYNQVQQDASICHRQAQPKIH